MKAKTGEELSFEPEELADYLPENKKIYTNSWEWRALVDAFNVWNKEKDQENLNFLRWRILDFNAACEKTIEKQEW